jgi:hypothetical protein
VTRDIALTEDDDRPGYMLAHQPDCPVVQDHREQERPICTMFGVTRPLPPNLKRHECLLK